MCVWKTSSLETIGPRIDGMEFLSRAQGTFGEVCKGSCMPTYPQLAPMVLWSCLEVARGSGQRPVLPQHLQRCQASCLACRKYLNSPTVVEVSRICTEFTRFYDNRIVRSGLKRQTKVFIKLLGTDAVLDRFLVSQCRTCMFQDLDAVQLQEWTRGPARAAALALPCLPVSLRFARVKLRSNLQLSSTLPSRRSPPTEQSKLPTSRDYQTAPSPTLSSRMSPAPTMNKASTAHASDME